MRRSHPRLSSFLFLSLSFPILRREGTYLISIKKKFHCTKIPGIISQSYTVGIIPNDFLIFVLLFSLTEREFLSKEIARARSPNRAMCLPFHFVMWRGGRKLKGAV